MLQSISSEPTTVCQTAIILTLRYGEALHADQEKLDYIYEGLKKMYQIDPLFGAASAKPETVEHPVRPQVTSTYPPIVQHWGDGQIETGDVLVDSVFVANGAYRVQGSGGNGYTAHLREPLKPTALAVNAEAIPDTRIDTTPAPDVGYDTWLVFRTGGMTATIAMGWGDCFNVCLGSHSFEVDIPDTGPASIVREWGDPIPDDVLRSFRNAPPPP